MVSSLKVNLELIFQTQDNLLQPNVESEGYVPLMNVIDIFIFSGGVSISAFNDFFLAFLTPTLLYHKQTYSYGNSALLGKLQRILYKVDKVQEKREQCQGKYVVKNGRTIKSVSYRCMRRSLLKPF